MTSCKSLVSHRLKTCSSSASTTKTKTSGIWSVSHLPSNARSVILCSKQRTQTCRRRRTVLANTRSQESKSVAKYIHGCTWASKVRLHLVACLSTATCWTRWKCSTSRSYNRGSEGSTEPNLSSQGRSMMEQVRSSWMRTAKRWHSCSIRSSETR